MSLKPFFTYYGGKWRAAPKYPKPLYSTIIEPFAGAAGYSLRHPDKNVWLVDKDPKIVRLWEYLITSTSKDIKALPENVVDVDTLDVPEGAKYLIGFWLNKGTAQPSKTPSAWMRKGTHTTSFWGRAIKERIASQVERIKHWVILHGDYTVAPDVEATWFIDPPYEIAGLHYKHGSKGLDFTHLGSWCKERKGQVIVCENEGASWLPFQDFATIKGNESRHGGKKSVEVIYTQ